MKLNGICLEAIAPHRGRYSPNLYCWLLRSCGGAYGLYAHVYQDSGGRLAIGVIDDEGDFVGQYLDRVLDLGEWAPTNFWSSAHAFTEIQNFWRLYLANGIDFLNTLPRQTSTARSVEAAAAVTT